MRSNNNETTYKSPPRKQGSKLFDADNAEDDTQTFV